MEDAAERWQQLNKVIQDVLRDVLYPPPPDSSDFGWEFFCKNVKVLFTQADDFGLVLLEQ